jgi:hypothetical protein
MTKKMQRNLRGFEQREKKREEVKWLNRKDNKIGLEPIRQPTQNATKVTNTLISW